LNALSLLKEEQEEKEEEEQQQQCDNTLQIQPFPEYFFIHCNGLGVFLELKNEIQSHHQHSFSLILFLT
jgi:hypothetical protein